MTSQTINFQQQPYVHCTPPASDSNSRHTAPAL